MSSNTIKYKIVPAFTGGYNIIAIDKTSWKEVSGPYMAADEAQVDLDLFNSGDVVDNEENRQNRS